MSGYDLAGHLYTIQGLYLGRPWKSIRNKIGAMFVAEPYACCRRTEGRFIEQSIHMGVECFYSWAMGDTIRDEFNIIGFETS